MFVQDDDKSFDLGTGSKIEHDIRETLINDPMYAQTHDYVNMQFPDIDAEVQENYSISNINKNYMLMFPDLETAITILIATLSKTPTYKIDKVSSNISNFIIEEIRDVEQRHDMEEVLPEAIRNIFIKGAHCVLSVKADIVSGFIKSITESDDAGLTDLLGTREKLFKKETNSVLGFSLTADLSLMTSRVKADEKSESRLFNEDDSLEEELGVLFRDIGYNNVSVGGGINLDTFNVEGSGKGTGFHRTIDSNLVVPVTLIDASRPLGYLVALSPTGGLINTEYDSYYNSGLISNYSDDNKFVSGIKTEFGDEYKTFSTNYDGMEHHRFPAFYNNLIRNSIKEAFKDSDITGDIAIPDLSQISLFMFNRGLASLNTRVMFVPADMMTYYSLYYRENKTGKSLMEIIHHLLGQRAVLTMAQYKSDVEAAVKPKIVDIILDPELKMSSSLIKEFVSAYNRHTEARMSTAYSIADARQIIQRYTAFRVKHPTIPNHTVNEELVTTGPQVDSSRLNETLDKLTSNIFRPFGITSQMITDTSNTQFAVEVLFNNELSKLSWIPYRRKLVTHYRHHILSVLRIDESFKSNMFQHIKENKEDYMEMYPEKISTALQNKYGGDENKLIKIIFKSILRNLVVEDTTFNNTSFSDRVDELSNYIRTLEMLLPIVMRRNFSTKIYDSEMFDIYLEAFTASLIKRWLYNKGFLLEIAAEIDTDSIMDTIENFAEDLDLVKEYIDKSVESRVQEDVGTEDPEEGEPDIEFQDEGY